jgi:hypothetical protein
VYDDCKNFVIVDLLVSVLSILKDTLLHARPPDPKEPERSITQSLHEPIQAGDAIDTAGVIPLTGGEIVTSCCVFAEKSEQPVVNVAGHFALMRSASRVMLLPTVRAVAAFAAISMDVKLFHMHFVLGVIPSKLNKLEQKKSFANTPPRLLGEFNVTTMMFPWSENTADRIAGGGNLVWSPTTVKVLPVV